MPQQAHNGRWHRIREGTILSFLSSYQLAKVFKKSEDLHLVLNHALTSAMTSISTNAPLGNVLTATAERAGYGSVKNSA